MKQYNYQKPWDPSDTAWMNDSPESYLFFDIETTGLSVVRSDLYMIGCGYVEDDQVTVRLFFNDDGCSEPEMLETFCELSDRFDTIVTYNGDTFDLPYIKEKCRQFRKLSALDEKVSLDVYRKLRHFKKILQMDSMKQSDLEERMGLRRDTFLSGKELIDVYRQYLRTREEEQLKLLLTHNKDDVEGLYFVSKALQIPAFFEGEFEVLTVEEQLEHVVIRLGIDSFPVELDFTDADVCVKISEREACVRIPIFEGELRYFYPDYKNYYFLPKEQKALHKDVACYVDTAYRVKATPDTAYTQKSGRFVPAFQMDAAHTYRKEYKDKSKYIELDDEFLQNRAMMKNYVQHVVAAAMHNKNAGRKSII